MDSLNESSGDSQVVVTGLGAITPVGNSAPRMWESLIAGRSGTKWLSRFVPTWSERAIAGEVREFDPRRWLPLQMIRRADRSSLLGTCAALEAVRDAALELDGSLGPRAGVVFGSSLGGQHVTAEQGSLLRSRGARRVSPFALPNILPDAVSGYISILTGASGPNMAILSASATGASAVGEASEVIRRGDADIMIAGASEAPLTPMLYAAFAAMRTLASAENPEEACRPFDAHRTGFVPAEGAGALVLESRQRAARRGARIYAELSGYASGNDAFDMVASEPNGRGTCLAMTIALRKGSVEPAQVSYINAHGTGTQMNDRVEAAAIKSIFGDQVLVSSTKSMTGHLMGAAGAVEAVISVLALYHEILPPTINYRTPDPECDLDCIPNEARDAKGIETVISHSVGLGGHNATLVFRRL